MSETAGSLLAKLFLENDPKKKAALEKKFVQQSSKQLGGVEVTISTPKSRKRKKQ